MPQSLAQGRGSAFLVPINGPALALRYGETWIGRGSFHLSPAAEVLCSRKQASIQFGISGLKIECHGLNPLYFVTCQHANFYGTQEAQSLFKLCRGESTILSNGDRFYLISKETLLKVVVEPSNDSHNQLGPQGFPFLSPMRAPSAADPEEGQPISGSGTIQRPLGDFTKDMQSVIATVTGYEGLERTTLIKLINKTGAAFTGKWTPGHTHLVCWRFAGPKYEMAKRSGKTVLLNHRWFEDCLSANCRLPEEPYTRQSGEEAGPLLWKDTVDERCVPHPRESPQQLEYDHKGKQIINITEESGPSRQPLSSTNALGEASGHIAECSTQVRRKRRKENASSSRHSLTEQDVGTSPIASDGLRVGQARSPRNKSRRLVRKMNSFDQQLSNQRSIAGIQGLAEDDAAERTDLAGSVIDLCTPPQPSSNLDISGTPVLQQEGNQGVTGSPEFRTGAETANHTCDSNLLMEVPGKTPGVKQPGTGSPEAELACVICYTDRKLEKEAVLDCGHSFCFPCIHKWSLEAKSNDPVCPLCKAPFRRIVRRNRTSPKNDGNEQANPENEEFFVGVEPKNQGAPTAREWACISCHSPDSQDLFCVCSGCSARAIHIFCIDPPGTSVHDNWSCPRCIMHRHRAQSIGDWRRILPGNDAREPGNWYISRLDGQPISRAIRSINLEDMESGRLSNGSIGHSSMNRPRADRHQSTSVVHSRHSRRPRQQRMSSFLLRRSDQL